MTSAVAINDSTNHSIACLAGARRPHPHGVELLAARLGMTLVLWARRRSERTALDYDEHTLRYRELRAQQQREREHYERESRGRLYLL